MMLLTSIHESMADELVLLEFEDSLERYETFYEILENQILPLLRILLPPLTNQQDHL